MHSSPAAMVLISALRAEVDKGTTHVNVRIHDLLFLVTALAAFRERDRVLEEAAEATRTGKMQ